MTFRHIGQECTILLKYSDKIFFFFIKVLHLLDEHQVFECEKIMNYYTHRNKHTHTLINNAWCTSCTHADFWQAADRYE